MTTNRDHIISLAKECGFSEQELDWFSNTIPRFYYAAQREAYEKAAQLADELQLPDLYSQPCVDDLAEAIRKLKEES